MRLGYGKGSPGMGNLLQRKRALDHSTPVRTARQWSCW
jgi:hypothetical protein